MTVQKSFHRYVARAKQGGVQSQHDSGGKGAAKSAGAQLRRYFVKISNLLNTSIFFLDTMNKK